MDRRAKIVLFIPVGIVCLFLLGVVGDIAWTALHKHPAPEFTIGNDFNQPVVVYINGKNMGKVKPGESRKFYPYKVITSTDVDLSVELKSNSGTVLYARLFTYDEALETFAFGRTQWIGDSN